MKNDYRMAFRMLELSSLLMHLRCKALESLFFLLVSLEIFRFLVNNCLIQSNLYSLGVKVTKGLWINDNFGVLVKGFFIGFLEENDLTFILSGFIV